MLHYAANEGNLKIVDVILKTNINLEAITTSKQTALHLSVQQGYFDITKRLIEAGAILTALDDEKSNIIHVCASNKHIELLKYLLEKCPLYLVNEKNIYGKLPKDVSKDDSVTKLLCEQEKHNNQGVRIHIFDAQNNDSIKRKRPKEVKTHASSTGNNRNININISTNIGNINNIVNQVSTAHLPSGANSLKKFKCEKSPISGNSTAKEGEPSSKLGFSEAHQASKVNIKAVSGKMTESNTSKKVESKFTEIKQSKVPVTQINLSNAASSTTNASSQINLTKSPDYTDYENQSTKKFKIGGALTGKGGNAQITNTRSKITSATKTTTSATTTFNSKKEFSSAAIKNNIFSNMIQKEVIDLYNSNNNSAGNQTANLQPRPETTTQKNSNTSDYFVTKTVGKPNSIDCSLSGEKIKQILSHKAFDSQHNNSKLAFNDKDKTMEKPQKSTFSNQKKIVSETPKPAEIQLNIIRINSKVNKNESSMQINNTKDEALVINRETRSSTNKIGGKSLAVQNFNITNASANKNMISSKSVAELILSQPTSPNIKLDLSNKQIETDSEENEEEEGGITEDEAEDTAEEKKKNEQNSGDNTQQASTNIYSPEEKSDERIDDSNNEGTNNTNASVYEEKIGPTSFVCHALIGKGSFGEVYLVEKLNSGMLYAMKVLSKDKIMGNPY